MKNETILSVWLESYFQKYKMVILLIWFYSRTDIVPRIGQSSMYMSHSMKMILAAAAVPQQSHRRSYRLVPSSIGLSTVQCVKSGLRLGDNPLQNKGLSTFFGICQYAFSIRLDSYHFCEKTFNAARFKHGKADYKNKFSHVNILFLSLTPRHQNKVKFPEFPKFTAEF